MPATSKPTTNSAATTRTPARRARSKRQKTLAAKGGGDKNRFVPIATPLDQVAKSKDAPHRFKQLDKQERPAARHAQKEMQNFRQERQKLEATVKDTGDKQPTKLAMPKAPIAPMSDANKRVSGSQKSTGATRIKRDRRLQSGIGSPGNPSGANKTTTVAPGKLKDTPRVLPTNPQDPQLRTRRGLADQSRSGGERAKVQNPVQDLSQSPNTTPNLNPSQPRKRIEAAKPPINNRTFQNQPGGRVIPNSPLDAQQNQQGDMRRERSTQKPATGPYQQQPQNQQLFKQQQQFQQQQPQLRQQNEQPSQRQFNAQGQQGSNFRSNQPSGQPQGQPSQPQKNDKRGRDKDKDR